MPPDAAHHVALSKTLTEMVCQQKQAIWVANQRAHDAVETARILCRRPVRAAWCTKTGCLGAIHVYLEQGRFRQSDFDFTISLANITTVALVRRGASAA